jgi:general secretion pathway protein G
MHKHNFTLIEILVSVTIIAILAGMLIGGLNYASKRADTAKTQAILEEFQMALDAFKHDKGYYPPSSSEHNIVFSDTSGFQLQLAQPFDFHKNNKPYIEMQPGTLQDAWGNDIMYQCPGAHNQQGYDLRSYGPDGNPNTTDDLTNWKQN